MHEFSAMYYRTVSMVLMLILVPCVLVTLLVLVLLNVHLAEWLYLVLSFAGIFLVFFLSVMVIFRYGMVRVNVQVGAQNLRILSLNRQFLYPAEIVIPYSDIRKYTLKYDINHARPYISLNCRHAPRYHMLINPVTADESWDLWEDLERQLKNQGITSPNAMEG